MMKSWVWIGFIALTTPLVFAAEAAKPVQPQQQQAPQKGPRKNSVDFEEEVVEGMNKNPLDSLEHLGKNGRGNGDHLYQVRPDFKQENRQTVREMEFTP